MPVLAGKGVIMYVHKRGHWKGGGDYDQNDGVPGVVYILDNPALAEGLYKIGCTRYSGYKRAEDLNKAATTGMPGTYRCVFQVKTADCGRAEKLVFRRLRKFRRGKWGQEFFQVEIGFAKYVVGDSCKRLDELTSRRQKGDSLTHAFRRVSSPLAKKLGMMEGRGRLTLNILCGAVIACSLAVVLTFALFGPQPG